MRKTAAITAICLATCLSARNAFAFDGLTDAPGSHMESLRSCLSALFGARPHIPLAGKPMPVYGIVDYRWDSYSAIDLLSDASRDFDLYYSGSAWAHARTRDFDYGKNRSPEGLKAIEARALFDYVRFVGRWMARVRESFLQGRDAEAAYLLGALCHSYQDLWSDRGLTDGMRKALARQYGTDIDREPSRFADQAKRLPAWLAALPDVLGPAAGHAYLEFMTSGTDPSRPTEAKRDKLLKGKRDLYLQAFQYSFFAPDGMECLRYLDSISWDVENLDALLSDGQALEQASALKGPAELVAFLEARGYRF
jgi:hypothetical protein